MISFAMAAPRRTINRAKDLRRTMSLPEVMLWMRLRGGDRHFRRQRPVGPYILDFYCAEARLAVEVDGATHDLETQAAHDRRRDAWLAENGIRVLRLPARLILTDIEAALRIIEAAINP